MTGEWSSARDVAFDLAGWVQGGLNIGFLTHAPAWWVDGIRERLGRLDALHEEVRLRHAARVAEQVMGR